MKKLALALLILTLALTATALYLRLGAQLNVIGAGFSEKSAANEIDAWVNLYIELTDGTFQGTVLNDAEMDDASGYVFRTYSVNLRNLGMLRAEWISMAVHPQPADIIAYGESRGFTLPAFSYGTISATLLARAGSSTARTVSVEYYVFGRKFTIDVIAE